MPTITKQDILDASTRVDDFIHRTPILTSTSINALCEAQIFWKCDNFQRSGSYKMRGASNAILKLTKEQQEKGVTTHSSGNFAGAVALASKSIGIKAHVVMPKNSPQVKIEAVRAYGAEISFSESTLESREATMANLVVQHGYTSLHPSNMISVIEGQATMAFEVLNELNGLDRIIAPVGGGGLAAGTCLTAFYFSPNIEIIGAEPLAANDAFLSLREQRIVPNQNPKTIADGLRTQLGSNTFPIINTHMSKIVLAKEETIKRAMLLVWKRMKIIIEPSSAVALATILDNPQEFKNQKICILVTGGNFDISEKNLFVDDL